MSKTVFFTRPNYDDVTAYLYHFSKELLNESRSRGFKTLSKEGQNATKTVVEGVIKKNNPDFIMFNGHGNEEVICGQNDDPLIQYGENHELLRKRITYALACNCAQKLGRTVADQNTTFIGYSESFAVGMDINCQASIHRDKRAKMFLEPSNLLVKSILKGNSASEAVSKAKEAMKKNISLLRTDTSPDAKDYIPFLFNNWVCLEVLGQTQA